MSFVRNFSHTFTNKPFKPTVKKYPSPKTMYSSLYTTSVSYQTCPICKNAQLFSFTPFETLHLPSEFRHISWFPSVMSITSSCSPGKILKSRFPLIGVFEQCATAAFITVISLLYCGRVKGVGGERKQATIHINLMEIRSTDTVWIGCTENTKDFKHLHISSPQVMTITKL